jgi:energy-coupling factor transporter ATP-binding protein EcfA2
MRVQSLSLRNFKRFSNKFVDLAHEDSGLAKDLIVIVGENGAGKSSILQAIAATLGTATRRLAMPSDLIWPGFVFEHLGNAWDSPAEVDLMLEFAAEEVDATEEYFRFLVEQRPEATQWVAPGNNPFIPLRLRDNRVTSTNNRTFFQCRGREYARQILRVHPLGRRVFERVGTIFWYHDHRNATSLTPSDAGVDAPTFDLPTLRRRLTDWYYFHRDLETGTRTLRPGERDIYVAIQDAYAAIFPGRSMQGPKPRTEVDDVLKDPWFYFTDGKHAYELAELSGGERAVLPMVVDFANWSVHHSVILIDEIELHLHPPMQQAVVRALRGLGKNNQFIITTHSDAVVNILPDAAILRVGD